MDDVNIAEILERIRYVQDLAMVWKDELLLRDVDGWMEDSPRPRVPMRKEPYIMASLDQPIREISNDELRAAVTDRRAWEERWSYQSDTHIPSEPAEADIRRKHEF
jgi:hypothetical protein